MSVELLHYRPWRGTFRSPLYASWPIARVALKMIFRRKLFWALYGLALLMFFMFFFGQYLLSWAESQVQESRVNVLGARVPPDQLMHALRDVLQLNGRRGEMYATFFQFQGYMVMVVLALAGSMLVGNDFQHGSLPFYLSKPINRLHYLLGKSLAVAVFVNLMTTLPAIVLWVQYGLLVQDWSFFFQTKDLLWGMVGYGLVLTVCLSAVLLAAAVWVRRTVPLIMTWCTLFFFCRVLGSTLVNVLNMDARWRLIDLWNCMYCVGAAMLRADAGRNQPAVGWSIAVLTIVSSSCVMYLTLRIRAVEIVK